MAPGVILLGERAHVRPRWRICSRCFAGDGAESAVRQAKDALCEAIGVVSQVVTGRSARMAERERAQIDWLGPYAK